LPGVLWGPIYGDVHRKKYDMGIHFWCIFGWVLKISWDVF
jgi:hypothetical protein